MSGEPAGALAAALSPYERASEIAFGILMAISVAALQIGAGDRLLAQWNQGEGIGRYFNDGLSSIGAVFDAGGTLEPLRLTGVYLYYERKWAERWTTTAGVSELRTKSEGLRPADDTRVQLTARYLIY